jgi:transmembrane sensor
MSIAPNRKVFQAAATWYVQLQCEPACAATLQAWKHWLHSDPAHEAAWQHVEQLQRSLGQMPHGLAHRALGATRQRRQVLKMLLLLAGTGAIAWNARQYAGLGNLWADYRTAVGEQRQLTLADGSQVELNTDTRIDVQLDGQQRLLRLLQGEIMVRTGKDAARPFFVETAEGRVQALGTLFSVRQLEGSTRVGVLEDKVRIQPQALQAGGRIIGAGHAVEFTRAGIAADRPYPSTDAAWVQGQLIVLNTPLADVIDELARYRPGVMACDAQAGKLRVSGTFQLHASDAVLANLQASLPISVTHFTRYWVSVKLRNKHLG